MNINNFSFSVKYYAPDGSIEEIVEVKKVPRSKLRELILLQQKLLDLFVEHEGSLGNILSEESNWNLLKSTAEILPLANKENEYLDISKFEEDYIQIAKIFFTDSMDENGEYDIKDKPFLPSKIAKLHQLNYSEAMGKALEKLKKKKEKMEKQEKTEKE